MQICQHTKLQYLHCAVSSITLFLVYPSTTWQKRINMLHCFIALVNNSYRLGKNDRISSSESVDKLDTVDNIDIF